MDNINEVSVPDRYGPTQSNKDTVKRFHESCRDLVSGRYYWRNDGHHVVVTLHDNEVKLNLACPGDSAPDKQPWACMYDATTDEPCWVRHWIDAQAWVQDFLKMGLVHVVVNGPVPIVWSRTGHWEDPDLFVSPLAAILYACNVTAEEFGPGVVDVDWWDGPDLETK